MVFLEGIPVRSSKLHLLSGFLFGLSFVFVSLSLSATAQATAPNEWTWVGGNNTIGSNCEESFCGRIGVYGNLGTFAPGNIPGGRVNAMNWTDSSGNFWLFGGVGFDADGLDVSLNDLWEFNPSTNEWAWEGGSSNAGPDNGTPGVYGTLETPATGNLPGSREAAANWNDNSGNFWLLGARASMPTTIAVF